MVTMVGPRDAATTVSEAADRLYLTCTLIGERYLVPTGMVREVEEIGAITPVPATPPWLRGVMNLRGTIVPVIDLAHFLGLTGTSAVGGEALICVTSDTARGNDDDHLVALAVEGVSNIRAFGPDEIVSLPDGQPSGAVARYWTGFYRTSARENGAAELLGVLDLDLLLTTLALDEHDSGEMSW